MTTTELYAWEKLIEALLRQTSDKSAYEPAEFALEALRLARKPTFDAPESVLQFIRGVAPAIGTPDYSERYTAYWRFREWMYYRRGVPKECWILVAHVEEALERSPLFVQDECMDLWRLADLNRD